MADLNDIGPLGRLVERTRARLVIVDVLMAFVPTDNDAHRDQDIRHVLGRLAAMAEQTGCTVLLLRHLNKGTGRDPMYRGGGSIGIIGAARGGLLLARDPEDLTVRILAASKASNLAAVEPPSLRFRITDTPIEPGIHVGKIEWLGTSDYTARDLLAADTSDDIPSGTSVEECGRWLTDYLKGGDKPGAELKADAEKVGFTVRTVQRAAKKFGVEYKAQGFPRVTWWGLPPIRASDSSTETHGATGKPGCDQREQAENNHTAEIVATPRTSVATVSTIFDSELADTQGTFDNSAMSGPATQTGFQAPKGPNRCDECGFHIETQGHRADCSAQAGVP
jgi:AAA domain